MTRDEVLAVFREAGAFLEGHFILTSGLRSPVFLQKARVFMYPDKTEKLCKALADKIRASGLGQIDYIVSPALGGLIPGYETARHLGVPAMWVERETGSFAAPLRNAARRPCHCCRGYCHDRPIESGNGNLVESSWC